VLEGAASGAAAIAAPHTDASANPAGGPDAATDFNTLLQAAQQHQASTTGAAGATDARATADANALRTPLQQAGWASEFGERIVWMAKNDQQHAQLTLNPAHLGPVQIALSLDANQASAHFSAATPEARQAIEAALPRLREMLADAGIALGQAQVGTQARGDSGPAWQNPPNSSASRAGNDPTILATAASNSSLAHAGVRHGTGLVDLFA
jgi:flagellar hook-length control protein FliK